MFKIFFVKPKQSNVFVSYAKKSKTNKCDVISKCVFGETLC